MSSQTPLQRMFLQRAGGRVRRWHSDPYLHSAMVTVGQHSANVGLLVWELKPDNMPLIIAGQVVLAALFHDLGEQGVGDIPAPTKWHAPAEFNEYLDSLEDRINKQIGASAVTLDASQLLLLKTADFLDLAFETTEQLLLGNSYAFNAAARLRAANRDMSRTDWSTKATAIWHEFVTLWYRLSREQQTAVDAVSKATVLQPPGTDLWQP